MVLILMMKSLVRITKCDDGVQTEWIFGDKMVRVIDLSRSPFTLVEWVFNAASLPLALHAKSDMGSYTVSHQRVQPSDVKVIP
jgi:hypothetical protein